MLWLCALYDVGYLESCEEVYRRHVQRCEEETEDGEAAPTTVAERREHRELGARGSGEH